MTNNYIITIDGWQYASGSLEKISLTTRGEFARAEDGRFRIQYEESEATGFAGDTTTLTVEDGARVALSRTGKTQSSLILEKGRKHLCHYDTGVGTLVVGIYAAKIDNRLDEHGGSLRLSYKLDINSNTLSVNKLNITVRENQTNV